jgi:hypothetical protein
MRLPAFPALKVPPTRTHIRESIEKCPLVWANVLRSDESSAFWRFADDGPIGMFHFGGFLGLKKKYKPTAARIT